MKKKLKFQVLFYFLGLQPKLNAYFHDRSLTLAQMLTDFFQFYARDFDYSRDAACVISGDMQPKRFANQNGKMSPRNVSYFLDITNPLEPDLNVSANIQDHAVKKFRTKCEEGLTKLYRLLNLQKDFFTSAFIEFYLNTICQPQVQLGPLIKQVPK